MASPASAQTRAPERVHSTCPHDCPSTCALEVERLDDHTIGRVYGAKDNPYTAGVICAKVARYAERIHHPDRLTTPLMRRGARGSGNYEAVSWDSALDAVAEAFIQRTATHGAETIWPYFFAGTMGLIQRDGIERLRHVLGYSRQHSTICTALPQTGYVAGTGATRGINPVEMEHSDLIVIWGGNPVSTQVNVMHHISKARRTRGARLVVIDPYRTGTAQKADLHLMVRPGTDGALACAVMHILFRDGLADHDYMAKYTDVPAQLQAHLTSKTPQWAADITGVAAEDIETFAALYGKTKNAFIRLGYGFTRSRNGVVNMHAALCLPAVSGAWQVKGGGALYNNRDIYGIDSSIIKGMDVMDPRTRMLDQSRIGPILTGDPHDIGDGPPVTGLFIQNTNPMAVAPDLNKVHAGFAREDLFTCVHEQFMTETAAVADVVLPATMFLEHDDMYQAGGHTFLQVTRKVVEAPGECHSNHWVLGQLAQRLGATHAGFDMTEWELMDATLALSGLPDANSIHEKHWHDCALDFETAHYLNGFATPDKRFHFKPDWAALGANHTQLPALPDHAPLYDAASDEHPYRMVTAPARHYLNTSFTETPSSIRFEQRPSVLLHPDDCKNLNVGDGDRVRLGNNNGNVVVHAESFTGVQPGVVIVESVWPNHAFEEGIGINALVSADAGPPLGGAVFHDTAIWIRKL